MTGRFPSPGERRVSWAGAIVLPFVLTACGSEAISPVPPEPTGPRPLVRTLLPCSVPGVSGETLCGRYEVFEDRKAASGRTIILEVLVAKATFRPAEADPVVYFHGGPGGSSVDNAWWVTSLLAGARRQRDLVFVDQRGTGNSNRLSCEGGLPGGEASLFGTHFPNDHVESCGARLAGNADLRFYTTDLAVDDVAEALSGFGYDQVNLFGASYGTRMALVFLRRHESRVRSILLNGVAPPQRGIHIEGASNVDASLEWLFSDCETDPSCASAYPTFRADFGRLVSRFDNGPVSIEAELSDGSMATVEFSKGDFGVAIRRMLYDESAYSIAPWVEESLQTGGWAGFPAYYVARTRWVGSDFGTGMHLSVICSEDVAFVTEAEIQSATSGTLLGESLIRRYKDACSKWPMGSIPSNYREIVLSDKPAFIISGERDPVTPALWGTETAQGLSNSRHLVLPDSGHFPVGACLEGIQSTFLTQGDPAAVPITCAAGSSSNAR